MTSDTDNDMYLDKILKTEFPVPIKEDFALRVVKKAFRQMAIKQLYAELLVYAGVVLTGLLSLVVIIYFFNKESWIKWTGFLTAHLTLVIGAVFIFLFVFLVDRLLLPVLFLRKRQEIAD